MSRGRLRHRLRVLRRSVVDDGLQMAEAFAPIGPDLWAERVDMSEAERLRSGIVAPEIHARFRMRAGSFVAGITAADRLESGGAVWAIKGPPMRSGPLDRLIEISAQRIDPA